MRRQSIEHHFVEDIPEDLEDGKLYVSIRYRTASHLCACGCGTKVVTPIKPPRWHLTFDGDTVSLCPSVGNWQQPCRSHYWIKNNRVEWAGPWTDAQIIAGRAKDAADLHGYYASRATPQSPIPERQQGIASRVLDAIRKLMPRARER